MGQRKTLAKALTALVLPVAVAAAGCRDSGLPGVNTPLADAQAAEWSYPAYEAGETHAVAFGETEWMAAGPPIRIPRDLLVPVSHGEAELYALATDDEPYHRLYVAGPGGWTPLARVPVQGEAQAAEH